MIKEIRKNETRRQEVTLDCSNYSEKYYQFSRPLFSFLFFSWIYFLLDCVKKLFFKDK
jgi:hypothetical protein